MFSKLMVMLLMMHVAGTVSQMAELIGDILEHQAKVSPPGSVATFLCLSPKESVQLLRQLSQRALMSSSQTSWKQSFKNIFNSTPQRHQSFIVDLDCPDAKALLFEANVRKQFVPWNKWLLILENQTSTDLKEDLKTLNTYSDSDLTLASRSSETEFLLEEVYKLEETLILSSIGKWSNTMGVTLTTPLILSLRRINLHKALLKAVMVVTNNDTLNHLDDTINKHIDTITKVNDVLFKHVADILNASVKMIVVDTWGYPENGSWTGLSGYLQRGHADIGATGMFVTKERLPFTRYIASTSVTKNAFIFRQPPLSFVTNIFTLPFSHSVWLTSTALVVIIGFLLFGAVEWEMTQHSRQRDTTINTCSEVMLSSLAAVCQQGTSMGVNGIPSRIIMFLLYISAIFLYTSYSACIVALLQSSTNSIRTLEDLLNSGLTLGVEDVVYNRHYFPAATDPIRHAIYTKKVSPPGGPQHFVSLEEGLKRMRKGLYAFHVELGPGFEVISDTYLEEEKCGLETINFLIEIVEPWVGVSKKTPYIEILSIAYRKVHERGLQHRANIRFYQKKPECTSRGAIFVSVGIIDCYPALLILLYGILSSIGVMAMEHLFNRWTAMHLMILCGWILWFTILVSSKPETVTFISNVLEMQAKSAPPSSISSFLCWPREAELQLVQQFSKEGLLSLSISSVEQMVKQFVTYASHQYTTFVLNLTCPDAKTVLLHANQHKKLLPNNRWLLIRADTMKDLGHFLEDLDILLDSDMLLATQLSTGIFVMDEVYKHNTTDLVSKRIAQWQVNKGLIPEAPLISSIRRINLQKSLLKSTLVFELNGVHFVEAVLVVEDFGHDFLFEMDFLKRYEKIMNLASLTLLLLSKGRVGDFMSSKDELTPTKVGYSLYQIVLDILNASAVVFIQDSHGFKVNGTWSGQMGYLHRGEADYAISLMIPQQDRIDSAVYIAKIIDAGIGFYFRQPPLSFVQNLFTLPFSKSLWLAFAGLLLLIVIFLCSVLHWEYVQNLSPKQTWSDVVLLALGATCQQGSMVQSNGFTGRSIILLLLIMVMFLYTSYSANIVALLQATSNSIKTLEDLYQSGFTIAALDVKYNYHFFSTASDPLRRNIITQKVNPNRGRKHFYNMQDGLNKIKAGKFAFHLDLATADVSIMDTYKEDEKCGLTIVHFLTEATQLYACVSRLTQYKEVITIAYRKIDEYGLKQRFKLKFLMKPKCGAQDSIFVSVGIMECYPAILVLVYGLLCSLSLFIIEILTYKRKNQLWKRKCQLPLLQSS